MPLLLPNNMTEEDIAKIQETIRLTVNGKIDAQHKILEKQNEVMRTLIDKVDTHIAEHKEDMKEIKPALELVSGGKLVGRILSWTAGIAVGYAALKGFIKP